ncbi:MAG: HAMP domain-containing histidine kinase [Rhizobacter sp.]|nr:HAMP domain-containing histidine kinase [Ferruginibacter sp.]
MKLLQKTIRNYFIYSVFILLVAIPLFYFSIQRIVREDVDDDLLATKEMLRPKISNALLNNAIDQLHFVDQNISISISTYTREFDSLLTVEIYDSVAKEIAPHRVLTSHFTVNGKPCFLKVKTSLVDNDELIKSIATVEVILLLLLLAGLFIINRNLSKRIWKPFYATLGKLRKYKVEKHEPLALSKSSVSEFNDLNTSLEELTDRTHNSYLSQKEFTENASHEMQSPLAVFQSKLELLMQTAPLNEEQAQLMGDLADASQRMTRLNKSLVLLTKIDNNQFAETENISVNKVLQIFIQQYQPQLYEKQIRITKAFQTEISSTANKALIEILIGNLLGNAIRHNYINGSIDLFIKQNTLIIQNTGKAVALDGQKIFQRFQKDSTDSNSTGLGLEIVKKICAIYNCIISYHFADNLHCFTVQFNNL